MGSQLIESAAYCFQILLGQLHINNAQNTQKKQLVFAKVEVYFLAQKMAQKVLVKCW
jgi:hypothetical protein